MEFFDQGRVPLRKGPIVNRRGVIIVMSMFAAIWWTIEPVSSGKGSALLRQSE